MLEIISQADRRGIFMFLVMSFSMSFFRTWRYCILLALSGSRPNSIALFLVVLVRNLFSDLLPARAGTLIYIFILNTRLGVALDLATSSFALAFLFDIISLTPILILALIFIDPASGISILTILLGTLILAVLTAIILIKLPKMFDWSARLSKKLPFVGENSRHILYDLFHRSDLDVRKVRDSGLYGRVFTLSILIRLTKYAGLYFLLFALLAPRGYSFSELNITKSFFGFCAPELVASLPISGIAGFGAYEGTWAFVFELLGFPADLAKLTGVSHHLFTQVYGYGLGLLAMLALSLPIFKINSKNNVNHPFERRDGAATFYISLLACCAVASLLLYTLYHFA